MANRTMSVRLKVHNPTLRRGRMDLTIKVSLVFMHALLDIIFSCGFTGWLDLMHYYIIGFKTGVYPVITRDRIFLWGRLSPAQANTPDPIGKPTNYDIVSTLIIAPNSHRLNSLQQTQDAVWAVILLPTPAHIKLTCGPSIVSMELPSGLSKISLPLTRSCSVIAVLYRRGKQVLAFAPKGYTFTENPSNYNFNAFVAASP